VTITERGNSAGILTTDSELKIMLLIWGWRSRASVVSRGVFLCPQCGGDRNYVLKRLRRWFTLFFVPVIPLKTLAEYVECEACDGTFKTVVLDTPTTGTAQTQLSIALQEALVVALRATDSPAARAAALAAYAEFGVWTDDELATAVEEMDVTELSARLAQLALTLNEHGKERFLAIVAEVAATGGVIDTAGRAALRGIASDLTMSPAHTRGVISEVLQAARA